MEERINKIGFKPQKETIYNKFLPYSGLIDEESLGHLADIKAYLGRAVQFRDIKIGTCHWTGQLSKYIRLFGLKFSKEDHLTFIHLMFELITIPDLDYSLVQKFSQLLVTLLKKWELLSREDLVLPWRPLYELINKVSYSKYEHYGLVLLPGNVENVLKNLIKVCRLYFPIESTQEMLDEWRPLLCPFDITMGKGMYFFDLFLPTKVLPHEHDRSYKLWFDEFLKIWENNQNSSSWEVHLVNLFARLAWDTVGWIDWQPYVPKIFTRILQSLSLPVGAGTVNVRRSSNNYDINNTVLWIIFMMGGENNVVQDHLNKLFTALESFYHPSNHGNWTPTLLKLLSKLTNSFVRRVYRERFKKTWAPDIPDSHKLTESDITAFVQCLKPIVLLSMFSKHGPSEAASSFQKLAVLRPEIIIPPLLERTYPALETLTEPHRLTSCLHCVGSVARSMVSNPKHFPEGKTHVLPLMNLCLPGIDPNDFRKTLVTFQLLSTLVSLVPIVDCSKAVGMRTDLTETEREVCLATAQFEDFVLQFMDRVFILIENSAQETTRSDSQRLTQLTSQESMVEVALFSTFSSIMYQSSNAIYQESLQRLFRFVRSNVFEVYVAGRFVGDLLRGAIKVNTEAALKLFVPHFCSVLKNRYTNEELRNVEHLDHEFLWNLKLLSECVRCNGHFLVEYKDDLLDVLRNCIHLKCKDGSAFVGLLLRHALRAFTLTYALDYRSSSTDWNAPFDQQLPIREWGMKGDLDDIEMKWYSPGQLEKQAAAELLTEFLVVELDRIKHHIEGADGQNMDREELNQCLDLIVHMLMGAGKMLPVWRDEQLQLVESMVELKRYGHADSQDEDHISIDGKNVRKLVIETLRPLVDHMLLSNADDTRSLTHIIKIYSILILFHGSGKDEFDSRWKSLHIVKKSMENKLLGKKSHIRAILVDRIQLQHDLRVVNSEPKVFTALHKELFMDLFRLSVSRYGQVRKCAQNYLGKAMHLFAYSYRCLVDDVLANLRDDPSIEHHQYKGALYLIRGENKRSFTTKRSWEVMLKVWPALVSARHSEKPSILKLMDDIMDKLQKNIETTEISIVVPERTVTKFSQIWQSTSKPAPSLPQLKEQEITEGKAKEELRNSTNLGQYNELLSTLVTMAEDGNLSWKFHQIALEMVGLLTRDDVKFPAPGVRLFVNNMVHDTLLIRKMCLGAVAAILKVQKRPHKMVSIDPNAQCDKNGGSAAVIRPGERRDNIWHHYNSNDLPLSREKWDNTVFVEKTHWGYFTWPKEMKVYAPSKDQPELGRSLDDLSEEEKPIYEKFSNAEYIEKLLKYLGQEEEKGKDKFHSKYFNFFKGLFRNFDMAFIPLFRTHLERLVADTSHDKREHSHRLAAEIISGIIRGSKHWDYQRVEDLWSWLTPVIKTGLANMSVECVVDWGTAFATASESRDPRKLHHMFELLIDDPLRGQGGSFGDEGRLYVLQGALAQQEWRVPDLLQRLLVYFEPQLAHSYKTVRDRLGSVLVNIFMCDVETPNGVVTRSPDRDAFLRQILPQVEILKETKQVHNRNGQPTGSSKTNVMDTTDSPDLKDNKKSLATGASKNEENGESEEHKAAVRLFKTVMKWLHGSFTRNYTSLSPEVFKLLPMLFAIQSETKDTELKTDSMISLALMAHASLQPNSVHNVLQICTQVCEMKSWHARGSMLNYLQVTVFYNFFLMLEPEIVSKVKAIVIRLLQDEQLEVREAAAITLSGFLHCSYLKFDQQLLEEFEKLRRTRLSKKSPNPAKLLQRHAGVLGLCACVQAFPYDVPKFVPQILMDLSEHLNDPQTIQMTVKKTLSNFTRTHHDNWQDHKQKFTDDQLVVLTDLLVSPNYYA